LFDSDRPDEAAKPEIPCAGVAEFLLPCLLTEVYVSGMQPMAAVGHPMACVP